MTVARSLAVFGALNGAAAVTVGAFAAHGVEGPGKALLATAGQYQMIHAALAVACSLWPRAPRLAIAAGWLASSGGAVFAIALSSIALAGAAWMGAVAPVGGALMILGWLTLAAAAWRSPIVND
jgi:uncharacterized membrane protein YgdD (TMEM256/DUF423 family)